MNPIAAGPRVAGTALAALMVSAIVALGSLAFGFGVAAAADAPVSISSVSASFFPNPSDSGAFTASPSTPVTFTQEFPVINFNPPEGVIKCTNPTPIGTQTHPFTDVVVQPDGSCQTIVAQGSKVQAGAGDFNSFQAVFTGSLVISAPGRVTFNMYSDDGWILAIGAGAGGAQPTYVSGPMLNFPKAGTFTGYGVVGSYNVVSAPNANNLVVAFPSAGSFPFELDYSECCDGDMALTVTANGVPIPPIAGLAIDVRGITDGAQVSGKQRIEVVGTTSQPQQVELVVDGVSQQTVRAAPFAFEWDSTQITHGAHKLTLRAVDATGGTAEKQLSVTVVPVAAPPPAAPLPTLAPTQVTVALPATPTGSATPSALIIAAIAVLLLALAGAAAYFFYLIQKTGTPAPAPVVAAPAPVVAPLVEDKTEFIGSVPLTDLTVVGNRRPPPPQPRARLLVKPDREIPLSRTTETVIGRDSNNAGYVEDRQVSRHHARVICLDGDFYIEDLNSTNGTRVNGATISKQKLADKDQIGVGDTLITFSIDKA